MRLFITSIGEFIVYKSKNTYDEPVYQVDSKMGTMTFDCKWYDLETLRTLLLKLV
jgi:hypothetical protein